MQWFYRHFIRPVLFAQDPEEIHRLTIELLGWAGRHEILADALASYFGAMELPVTVMGLRFPNPVGLAAGMDKDGEAVPIWAALGFGHCELGAITWESQSGNASPRLFRAIADDAIINRMGFNNLGAQAMTRRLAAWKAAGRWPDHPVGLNLGKSKNCPLANAPEDYARTFRALWPYGDFFVVNVSSPNTPNLRQLQDKAALDEILAALQEAQDSRLKACQLIESVSHANSLLSEYAPGLRPSSDANQGASASPPARKPILIKVAPDLDFTALDDILSLVAPRQIAGLVATNTTLGRPEIQPAELQRIYAEPGGMSGRPLGARSTEVIRHLYRQSGGQVPIIGVGGIFNADDAWQKITAGASLIQVYTSLVYEGPGVVQALVRGLLEHLGRTGLKELSQAVGIASR